MSILLSSVQNFTSSELCRRMVQLSEFAVIGDNYARQGCFIKIMILKSDYISFGFQHVRKSSFKESKRVMSLLEIEKSNMSAFSFILSGFTDFGMITISCWRAQRRII